MQPQVTSNPNNPNQIDVKFDRQTRHERVSQSESLRKWSIDELNQIDWLEVAQVVLATATAGYGLLNLAWLIIPVAPAYHALIRWVLLGAPIVLALAWLAGFVAFLQRRVAVVPSGKLVQVAIGLWLVWFIHAAGN